MNLPSGWGKATIFDLIAADGILWTASGLRPKINMPRAKYALFNSQI